ncbi:MAG: tetratricopeptide repeat protein [Acidobacteriota bacterium]
MVRGRVDSGNLKRARERRGLRQSDAAAALSIAERHYRRVENGELIPSPELLERLLDWALSELELAESELLGPPAPRLAGTSVPSSSFVGRRDELRELDRRVTTGSRLTTIVGPPGVGKTRLVLQHADASADKRPGGTWFCDLSSATTPDEIGRAVALTFDVPLGGPPVLQLGHAIASWGRCLVILDNFEQVAEHAADTLGPWLELAPDARFVVTSREPLHLAEETTLMLDPLSPDEGLQLHALRARTRQPDFAVTPENEGVLRELVRLLDGLPLAIELAASRAMVLSPSQLLERLGDRFRLLSRGPEGSARQATLHAAIDWSWSTLEPWEQAAYAQVSVFEGGFDASVADEVLDLSAHPEAPPVREVLRSLVDKSLVRTLSSSTVDDEPRHDLFVSLREHAAEKLESHGPGADSEEATRRRHGMYFARFGEKDRQKLLEHPEQARLRTTLALELDNLLVACRHALDRSDGATATNTLFAAWSMLKTAGPLSVGVTLGEAVLALPELSVEHRGRTLSILVSGCIAMGAWPRAREHLESSIELHRAQGDRRAEGAALKNLGALHLHRADLEAAHECFAAARTIQQETGDQKLKAGIALQEGLWYARQQRIAEAKNLLETAHDIFREQGDSRMEGYALIKLGAVHHDLGEAEDARQFYEAALLVHRQRRDLHQEELVLGLLGLLLLTEGRVEEAQPHLETALRLARQLGSRPDEGVCQHRMGLLYEELDRHAEARASHEEAIRINREVGNRAHVGWALAGLARLHWRQDRLSEARACYDEALEHADASGDRLASATLIAQRGRLEAEEGALEQARGCLAQAEAAACEGKVAPRSPLGQEIAALRGLLGRIDGTDRASPPQA